MQRKPSSRWLWATACTLVTVLAVWNTAVKLDHTSGPVSTSFAAAAHSGNATHPLLRKLFVCVSFHFSVIKLVYLREVLDRTALYPTDVDVCIVTDAPAKLTLVLQQWRHPESWICGTHRKLPRKEPYALLWEHRDVIDSRINRGYTTTLYIEDDTCVTWEALQSWAADTQVLAPLGLIRAFYRTEVHQRSGQIRMFDTRYTRANLSAHEGLVRADVPPDMACHVVNPNDSFWRWREQPQGCAHTHYLSPSKPYMGMWVATAAQLDRFRQTKFWTKKGSLATVIQEDQTDRYLRKPWGYPEKSTAGIQFVDVPEGFWSRSVLAYDPTLQSLLPSSQVSHERNGYQRWLRIRPEDYLIKT